MWFFFTVELLTGPEIVICYFIFINKFTLFSNIEPLDTRGAAASLYTNKEVLVI